MVKFLSEFREFAMKGNVIDLAIGVIIGASFSKIVDSLVHDVIMPTFGLIIGKMNFSAFTLGPIKIGLFMNNVVSFVIVALTIFIVIKQINKFRNAEQSPIKQ